MTRVASVFARFRRAEILPVVDDEHWVDDRSGDREGWSACHIRQLSPHAAWTNYAILPPADNTAPAPQPEPKQAAPQPVAVERVVYDVDWLAAKLRRQPPGRHRAKVGAR